MTTLRKSARGRAGKGRSWLAALAAVALVVGMVPAAALAQDEVADVEKGTGPLVERVEGIVPSAGDGALAEAGPFDGSGSVPGGSTESPGDPGTVPGGPAVEPDDPFDPVNPKPHVPRGPHFAIESSLGDGVGYTYEYAEDGTSGLLTIDKPGNYTVFMAPGVEQTSHRIKVVADATVTLAGVNIRTTGPKAPPIDTIMSDVTLVLAKDKVNTVVNVADDAGSPGVRKMGESGKLVITGPGSLFAQGGSFCAAIGGANVESAGGIRIEGGSVTAIGGSGAAAIGSGKNRTAGVLVVAGGTVVAKGGAVGIGGITNLAQVSITGGTVRAERGIGVPGNTKVLDDSAYVRISGGSIETDCIYPTPTYVPAAGDSVQVNHMTYQVREGYDSTVPLERADLLHADKLPEYYNLFGVVPDGQNRVHLWHKANVFTVVNDGLGRLEAVYSPSANAVLRPDAALTAELYEATFQQVAEVIGTAPGFGDSQLKNVPEVSLSKEPSLYDPAKLVSDPAKPKGENYFIGDVIARGEGDAAQTFVVSSVSPYVPAAGDDPEHSAFLNAVDVNTGWTSKVTDGEGGLAFANPVRVPNVPLNEASGFVKVNGALYALTWEAFAVTEKYDEYSWHYLSTVDGKPAGYYHVAKSAGEKDAVVSGHFNVDCDPASIEASGDGLVVPVEGQVEAPDGSTWAAFLAGSHNLSLTGAAAEQGPLGTLETRQNASALDRLMGSPGLDGAANRGGLVFASGHFSPRRGLEPAESCEVVALDGGPEIESVYTFYDLSPFVTVALAKAPSVPVKHVALAEVNSQQTVPIAAKPLAATGDPAAAAAATLAALALAAAAFLALARRRAN